MCKRPNDFPELNGDSESSLFDDIWDRSYKAALAELKRCTDVLDSLDASE